MGSSRPEGYTDEAHIWSRPGVGTPVVVCETCGSVVATSLVPEHEAFHAGLAELWAFQVS